MNSDRDLAVAWENDNDPDSGITQDVSVRIRLRWVGA
jgi:hypothetical protein